MFQNVLGRENSGVHPDALGGAAGGFPDEHAGEGFAEGGGLWYLLWR